MAGLQWVAVTLAVLLSAENSLAAVDQNTLATIVNGIVSRYGTQGMFSLAVRIPYNQNQNQNLNRALQEVITSDPPDDVKKKIKNTNTDVYKGNRVVAAKVLTRTEGEPDHAEYRVVNNLFTSFNQNDLLLFYVYTSPCDKKCTNKERRDNILENIKKIQLWNNYAFVFSKIFKPRSGKDISQEKLNESLERLGQSIGLENIFRCDRGNNGMRCTSCSDNGQVAKYCVSDDAIF